MEIIEDIRSELLQAGLLQKSGTAFMSHVSTLCKGKYLVVGLNPGGDSKGCPSIGESLENFTRDEYSPFDEKWDNTRYQQGIKALFEHLDVDLKTVCATNLIYERSKTEKDMPMQSIDAFRKILRMVVSYVEPTVIIILGKKVLSEVRSIVNASIPVCHDSGHKRYYIYTSDGVLNGRQIKLICLPHLSRYALYNRHKQLHLIKNQIGQ